VGEVANALGRWEAGDEASYGGPERLDGARRLGAEQGLELGEDLLDCVSMLPLYAGFLFYAGFLLRSGVGGSVLIRSRSPALIRTSQMRCPPRAAMRPRRRPSRSQR
jgi:hypothetical protein